jgi:hypothetical protein
MNRKAFYTIVFIIGMVLGFIGASRAQIPVMPFGEQSTFTRAVIDSITNHRAFSMYEKGDEDYMSINIGSIQIKGTNIYAFFINVNAWSGDTCVPLYTTIGYYFDHEAKETGYAVGVDQSRSLIRVLLMKANKLRDNKYNKQQKEEEQEDFSFQLPLYRMEE